MKTYLKAYPEMQPRMALYKTKQKIYFLKTSLKKSSVYMSPLLGLRKVTLNVSHLGFLIRR